MLCRLLNQPQFWLDPSFYACLVPSCHTPQFSLRTPAVPFVFALSVWGHGLVPPCVTREHHLWNTSAVIFYFLTLPPTVFHLPHDHLRLVGTWSTHVVFGGLKKMLHVMSGARSSGAGLRGTPHLLSFFVFLLCYFCDISLYFFFFLFVFPRFFFCRFRIRVRPQSRGPFLFCQCRFPYVLLDQDVNGISL